MRSRGTIGWLWTRTVINHNESAMTHQSGSSAAPSVGGRRKKPDWTEFYKNGLPKDRCRRGDGNGVGIREASSCRGRSRVGGVRLIRRVDPYAISVPSPTTTTLPYTQPPRIPPATTTPSAMTHQSPVWFLSPTPNGGSRTRAALVGHSGRSCCRGRNSSYPTSTAAGTRLANPYAISVPSPTTTTLPYTQPPRFL
jgi:hypothetical protein